MPTRIFAGRMMSRRRAFLGIAAVAVVAAAGVAFVSRDSRGASAGPLACHHCPTNVNGLCPDASANQFTFNVLPLTNSSSEPVTLDGVQLKNPSSGVRVTKLAVAKPGTLSQLERAAYNAKLFPAGSTKPLPGGSIPPGTSANNGSIVVYLEVPAKRGTYTISGLVLDYHQGSTKYQATYPEQARICLGQTSCSSDEVTQ